MVVASVSIHFLPEFIFIRGQIAQLPFVIFRIAVTERNVFLLFSIIKIYLVYFEHISIGI